MLIKQMWWKQKTTHPEMQERRAESLDDVDDPDDFGGSEWWTSASVTLNPGLSSEITIIDSQDTGKHQH